MSPEPFGRAVYDHYHGEREEPLIQRDGEQSLEHPIEEFYFQEYTEDEEYAEWLESRLDGPLLDMGAGAGKHALYFQERVETTAIEVAEDLVSVMDDRGVRDARVADMFSLPESFERDEFRSALAYGTQLGLAGSMDGLREFLGDLAFVTDKDATAVVDCLDPEREGTADLLGFRPDPTPGLAFRVMSFAYGGTVGDILLFRLFSPERLREATVGTPWEVSGVRYGPGESSYHYLAALSK